MPADRFSAALSCGMPICANCRATSRLHIADRLQYVKFPTTLYASGIKSLFPVPCFRINSQKETLLRLLKQKHRPIQLPQFAGHLQKMQIPVIFCIRRPHHMPNSRIIIKKLNTESETGLSYLDEFPNLSHKFFTETTQCFALDQKWFKDFMQSGRSLRLT